MEQQQQPSWKFETSSCTWADALGTWHIAPCNLQGGALIHFSLPQNVVLLLDVYPSLVTWHTNWGRQVRRKYPKGLGQLCVLDSQAFVYDRQPFMQLLQKFCRIAGDSTDKARDRAQRYCTKYLPVYAHTVPLVHMQYVDRLIAIVLLRYVVGDFPRCMWLYDLSEDKSFYQSVGALLQRLLNKSQSTLVYLSRHTGKQILLPPNG